MYMLHVGESEIYIARLNILYMHVSLISLSFGLIVSVVHTKATYTRSMESSINITIVGGRTCLVNWSQQCSNNKLHRTCS